MRAKFCEILLLTSHYEGDVMKVIELSAQIHRCWSAFDLFCIDFNSLHTTAVSNQCITAVYCIACVLSKFSLMCIYQQHLTMIHTTSRSGTVW